MIIKRLKLENWRNYLHQEAAFDESVNIIYGANAQGKTNLLEAISYLGMASSFRTTDDLDLINKNKQHFYLEAEAYSATQGRLTISAAMNRDKKRKWVVNGQPRRRLVDIVGIFHTVIFFAGGYLPGQRRSRLPPPLAQPARSPRSIRLIVIRWSIIIISCANAMPASRPGRECPMRILWRFGMISWWNMAARSACAVSRSSLLSIR